MFLLWPQNFSQVFIGKIFYVKKAVALGHVPGLEEKFSLDSICTVRGLILGFCIK